MGCPFVLKRSVFFYFKNKKKLFSIERWESWHLLVFGGFFEKKKKDIGLDGALGVLLSHMILFKHKHGAEVDGRCHILRFDPLGHAACLIIAASCKRVSIPSTFPAKKCRMTHIQKGFSTAGNALKTLDVFV